MEILPANDKDVLEAPKKKSFHAMRHSNIDRPRRLDALNTTRSSQLISFMGDA